MAIRFFGIALAATAALLMASSSLRAGRAGTAALPAQIAPPIADPQQLVAAYYQALQDAVNSGDFSGVVAFFTPDAGIDSPLVAGGANGQEGILQFFNKLPRMTGFTVEVSAVFEADPYVDADWRFRAAPGSLRGYLDGHDTFTIQDGLIANLQQQVDAQAVAEAFMPPPVGRPPREQPVARDTVRIAGFRFAPAVIQAPVNATVTWVNDDADSHTVTTDDRGVDSGVIEQGVSVGLSFATPGEYDYYCTIHPGMRGTVIVTGR